MRRCEEKRTCRHRFVCLACRYHLQMRALRIQRKTAVKATAPVRSISYGGRKDQYNFKAGFQTRVFHQRTFEIAGAESGIERSRVRTRQPNRRQLSDGYLVLKMAGDCAGMPSQR